MAEQSDSEEAGVEIHRPRRWRGFRGFAKEYMIIVVGVLTALAGEQTVGWLNERRDLAEARQALRDEMTQNATAMQLSLDGAPCFQRRLDGISAWADGGPPPKWDSGLLANLSSSAWDEAKTVTAAQMPLKERIAYDRFYAAVEDRAEAIRQERAAMAEIVRYMGQAQVPPEERVHAREDVARVKGLQMVLTSYDHEMLGMAKAMNATPQPYPPGAADHLATLCDRPVAAAG